MKILCLLPVYYPAAQYGGFIFCTHNLNRALVEQGHQVEVYTTNAGNSNVKINEPTLLDGVKITYFSYSRFFDFLTSTGWHHSPKMAKEMKNELPRFDLVIINVIWNYPTLAAAYYCKKYRIPYMVEPHGSLYPYTLHKKYWKKFFYYNFLVKSILTKAAAMIYTTRDEFSKTHHYLGLKNKAIIVPNGLNLAEFEKLPTKEALIKKYPKLKNKKIVLYLGRIHWKKGLDLLIKAFAKLANEGENVILLIVGNDERGYIKKVRQWIKEEKIDNKVLFTGLLVDREKLVAYCGSDVFVLPSYSENFGMTVAEAMACGVPVVISDQVGVYREVREQNAGVIVKCNPESVYRGIRSVLEHPERAKSLSARAKKMVRDFYDVNLVAKELIKQVGKTIK